MNATVSSALAALVLLVSSSSPAAAQPWEKVRELVRTIEITPSILDHPLLSEIGHATAPTSVRGFTRDLDADGKAEVFVESHRSVCGQAGCAYAVFDGASGAALGQMSGNLVRVGSKTFNGRSTLEWSSHISADRTAYAVFAYTGSRYEPVAFLELDSPPGTLGDGRVQGGE